MLDTGGPGSGKMSHCERYLDDHRGFIHANATMLLLQNRDKKGNLLLII